MDSEGQTVESKMAVDKSPRSAVAIEKSVSRISKQSRSSRHDPVGDCSKCHIGAMGSGQRQLVKPMPDLCYSCHTNYHVADGYLHGPIVVGECVFCHDSHQSKYVHLQKAPQPKLCYQCHLPEDVVTIADHQEKQETICTDCHDPHVSSMRKLLKSSKKLKEDPNTINLSK
ncbi:MAG: cytochrome c3 family protein [Planctomycetota bacterium]